MPHFLYTVIFITLGLWGILIKAAYSTEPSDIKNIFVILILFLFALSLTLSVPIYFYLTKKSKNLIKHKQVFRKSIKMSFILGLGVTTLMALKAFELINVLNVSLFLIPYALIFWQEVKNQ